MRQTETVKQAETSRHTEREGASFPGSPSRLKPHQRVIGSRDHFRLNPAEHSHHIALELPGSALIGRADVKIERSVTVEGTLRCGITTRVAAEGADFRGVAARLSLTADDEVVSELLLLHRDPSLHVPLARSDDMEALAADWQMWAKRYNLPLVLIEADGVEQMISCRLGGLDIAHPRPRRPHSFVMQRRPRFLKRRKVGFPSACEKISGREIIARN